jgi:hypothetical protein
MSLIANQRHALKSTIQMVADRKKLKAAKNLASYRNLKIP